MLVHNGHSPFPGFVLNYGQVYLYLSKFSKAPSILQSGFGSPVKIHIKWDRVDYLWPEGYSLLEMNTPRILSRVTRKDT